MAYAQYVEIIRLLLRHVVRVLDLPTLIELKRRAGRPKDMAAMHVLEATLDEVRKLAAK